MKNWDDLRLILAIERTGTLRRAAAMLGVSHATVSRRLAKLDQTYDGPVFERTVECYRATSIGNHLLAVARQMEVQIETADRKCRNDSTYVDGPIRLSVTEVHNKYLLLEALAKFNASYPGIELDVVVSSGLADLDRSEADIVVRCSNNPPEHLVGRKLFPVAFCGYARTDYFEKNKPESFRWIADGNEHGSASFAPKAPIGMRLSSISARCEAAVAGYGMAILPCFVGDKSAELSRNPNCEPDRERMLWVLTHPAIRETPRIRLLTRFLAEALTAQKASIMGYEDEIPRTAAS